MRVHSANELMDAIMARKRERGLSDSQLAIRAGITRQSIYYWGKGRKKESPQLENLFRALNALGLEMEIKEKEWRPW